MKHEIPQPDLAKQFEEGSPEERREQMYLAFEAEYDINRPFEVQWGPEDKYFSYNDCLYVYKPQFAKEIAQGQSIEDIIKPYVILTLKQVSQSPHLIEFVLE